MSVIRLVTHGEHKSSVVAFKALEGTAQTLWPISYNAHCLLATFILIPARLGQWSTRLEQCIRLIVCNQLNIGALTGSTLADLKEYTVEGTSFNPAAGGIIGKMTLHKNMEVKLWSSLRPE